MLTGLRLPPPPKKRRAIHPLTVGLCAWLGAHLAGATGQAPERHVSIDFYALGTDGAAVTDLRTEEVTVKISGRTRVVRSLRLVRQGSLPASDALAVPSGPASPFGSNSAAEQGRSFIVVVDDESFRPGKERPIRSALRAFLGSLAPADRVSLWTVPHGGIKVDLTKNHDRVADAMQVVSGQGSDQETLSEASCRTRNTLEALEHMLTTLTGGEGPVTVMVFTAGLYGPQRDAPARQPPGMCELTVDPFQRVGETAAGARAHFYVIQPEDLVRRPTTAADTALGVGFWSSMNPLEGIEHLAGVTGGSRMSLTRLGDATLVGIARATASYYAATVDGAATDGDLAVSLDVKVTRPGVETRSRAYVMTPRPAGVTQPARSAHDMLRVSTTFSALPLRITAFVSQNDGGGGMRVVAAAEPADPGVTLTDALVGYFDRLGKLVGQVNLAPELAARPLLASIAVPAGAYRVRIAAVDSTGRGGTADADLVAEMTEAGPLKLSSLVLGLWRDNQFQPRLQFSTEPVAIAFLDFTGGAPGAAVSALVELARTGNGPAIVTTRLALEPTSDPRRFTASGAIPIANLPPGDYVVRAIVGVEGQPAGRVTRTLRKAGQ